MKSYLHTCPCAWLWTLARLELVRAARQRMRARSVLEVNANEMTEAIYAAAAARHNQASLQWQVLERSLAR